MATKRLKPHGSALLSALFIMTLVAIATTSMTVQLRHSIEQTRLVIATDQHSLMTEALRYWAMAALVNPKTRAFGRDPSMLILTDAESPMPKLPGVKFSAQIFDLQALFNINNLANINHLKKNKFKTPFYRLLKDILDDESGTQAFRLADAITDWVTDAKSSHGGNKYSGYYAKQKPPYVTAHQPMASLSELRLIQGVTLEVFQTLFHYVTVLPPETKLNINTAPETLLMAFGEGEKPEDIAEQVQALIEARGEKGLQSPNQVHPILKKLSIELNDVTVESEYFLSIGQATTPALERTLYSLLRRTKAPNGTFSVHLVQETWNTN